MTLQINNNLQYDTSLQSVQPNHLGDLSVGPFGWRQSVQQYRCEVGVLADTNMRANHSKDSMQNVLGPIQVLGGAIWCHQCPFIVYAHDQ